MPSTSFKPQTDFALVVLGAKEHGKVFSLSEGSLTYLAEAHYHPPHYSDNEGFFTHSSGSKQMGSGNVREDNEAHVANEFSKSLAKELEPLLNEYEPETLLLIEPEYLKGNTLSNTNIKNSVTVIPVAYGNYVDSHLKLIREKIYDHFNNDVDPGDPASVVNEEDAEEKRKILSIHR